MTATNHALTGAVIALTVGQTWLMAPLAIISHYLIDYIPHFSFPDKLLFSKRFNIYLIFDALLCIILAVGAVILYPNEKGITIAVIMFLATSPDFVWAYYRLYVERIKRRKPRYDRLNKWHLQIQSSSSSRYAARGIRNEILWGLVMTAIIIFQI